jgi:uncharacterized protein DUF4375
MQDQNKQLIALSENPEAQFWKVSYQELTAAEKVFVSVWELESEVNNGGFLQYFLNSSGDNAGNCFSALEKIGATNVASMVKEALTVFADSKPNPDAAIRRAQVENFSEKQKKFLEDLDQRFFKYPDNLTKLLFDFVTKNRNEIRGFN